MKLTDLTERQLEVLKSLQGHRSDALRWASVSLWARPLDVGGCSRSYHSAVLNQLAAKGLVEIKPLAKGMTRPPKYYKITPAGLEVLGA